MLSLSIRKGKSSLKDRYIYFKIFFDKKTQKNRKNKKISRSLALEKEYISVMDSYKKLYEEILYLNNGGC